MVRYDLAFAVIFALVFGVVLSFSKDKNEGSGAADTFGINIIQGPVSSVKCAFGNQRGVLSDVSGEANRDAGRGTKIFGKPFSPREGAYEPFYLREGAHEQTESSRTHINLRSR